MNEADYDTPTDADTAPVSVESVTPQAFADWSPIRITLLILGISLVIIGGYLSVVPDPLGLKRLATVGKEVAK